MTADDGCRAKAFGDYIRQVRTGRKLSIRKVEELTGISNGYLSLVETGKRDVPSPDILRKLSNGLNVPYCDLMTRAGYIGEQSHLPCEREEGMELSDLLNRVKVTLNGKPFSDEEKQRMLDIVTGVFWDTHGGHTEKKDPPTRYVD